MRSLILGSAVAAVALQAWSAPAQQIASRAVDARTLPREVAYRGSAVAARRWTDRLGENVLLLTRSACLTPSELSR